MAIDKKYIHYAIMFLLTAIICLCPPFGQITKEGMLVLGVFVGVLYGGIFIDLIWPSFFGFTMLGILQLMGSVAAFATGFSNATWLMCLIVMIFAGAMEAMDVTTVIANWLLSRTIFQKSPWALIVGIAVISYILGLLGLMLAVTFMMWAIIGRIAEECHISKNEPILTYVIALVVMISTCAGITMPFQGASLMYMGYYTQAMGSAIPSREFMIFAISVTILNTIVMILIGKFVMRLDASKFQLPQEIIAEIKTQKATSRQKVGLAILMIYTLILVLPAVFDKMPGASYLNTIGIMGVTAVALLLVSFIKIEGQPLADLTTLFSTKIQWPLMLLLAVTFPLASLMQSSETGIMATVTAYVTPMVSQMGASLFMIGSMVILGLVTQVTHNIVLAAIFMPILCPLCAQLGANPITLWFLLYITLQCAYVTPAASFTSALVHGHGLVDRKYAYILGIVFLLITYVVLGIVGIPLGNLLF